MPSLIKQIKKIFKSNKKTASPATTPAPVAAKAAAPVAAVAAVAPVAPVIPAVAEPSHPENDHVNHTFAALAKSDAQLASLADHHYSKVVSAERVEAAKAGLEKAGFKVHYAKTRGEAFETVKSLIPAGASVNNAHSTSLEEIGFITYLKGQT
ncbi:hypothetical protein EC991_001358 [Linnemannia zychae]|nr:hypothetical protein EC991_001358 [Linnemannia zychae]